VEGYLARVGRNFFLSNIAVYSSSKPHFLAMTALSKRYPIASMSNLMIRGVQSWTLSEAKILALALGHIHKETEKLPLVAIPFSDVYKSYSNKNYDLLREACKGLKEKTVQLDAPKNKRSTTFYSIFRWIKLEEETKMITGEFEENISQHLLNLTEFTQVEIETILLFKNPHAARLYWLLKSYWMNVYTTSVEHLRKQLLGDKEWDTVYPVHADFSRYVLKKALAEIKELSGWDIKMKEIKAGRSVSEIQFTMEPHVEKERVLREEREAQTELALPPAPDFDEDAYVKTLSDRPNNNYVKAWRHLRKFYEIHPLSAKQVMDEVDKFQKLDELLATFTQINKEMNSEKEIKHRDSYAWTILIKTFKNLPEKVLSQKH
jgi:plasmid replication initiation protein